ncbi:discoidin domain-containing protein [Actinocrinis sp.]|uniref:discoidin domain-containing protein n=1 Tax=Actinocrinis sp. TaxID=1920516 RepID=UPI002D6538EE|nr:discoidin domain-containing protein [Actinocrinis sp.]HZP50508.1 discoidin domain-containing protein [Actinocrinis sp.]
MKARSSGALAPRRPLPRWARAAAAVVAALSLTVYALVASTTAAHAAPTLLSQGKPTTASSLESAAYPASNATDGNTGTRWSSAFSDPQWLQVDLGQSASISQVVLQWEAAYATSFQIQTSNDASTWTSIYSTTTGTGGTQTLNITGTGRYVRMYGTARATGYGYSLWEFQVYGTLGAGGGCGTSDAALGKPATASSLENATFPASNAVDGNTGTRWSSAFSDPQWLQVDLGSTQSICQVSLNWEAAYASAFQIQTSNDASTWTSIYSTTTGAGGTQTLNVSGSGRYIRMYGTTRATPYGYSLWEFGVFTGSGTGSPSPSPSSSSTGGPPPGCTGQSNTPNFGPNVDIFDPSMSASSIQSTLDSVFNTQKLNQFGTQRYALLFKPGAYSAEANIGYYTSIQGLGQNPDDVTINGDVTVDAFDGTGNATQNFWRSAENLAINPSSGSDRWAVAQAGPFRRVDVHGGLEMYPASYGYASGGYVADSKVSGQASSVSQQQWYTQDSNLGSWSGSVWNMVFSGVNGAPAQSFPSPPMTTLATTPVSRDVPYLYVDSAGGYHVFLPSLRTNASGPSWNSGPTPGSSVPMSQFFVVTPSNTAAQMNAALAQGCSLFFTPGVYNIDQTLQVNNPNTVVMGLGFPTLIPVNGVDTIHVADVDGVRLDGLLLDAGTTNSNALLTVGTQGSTVSHAANPDSIQDVFFRIGGDIAGKATNSLIVNADNTLINDIWAWRADHGNGGTVGWTTNTAAHGLVVNGDNVLATGLFVEHYQNYEVQWNGNGGETIFFQNENPYDPPNQAAWMNGSTNGYAAYEVAPGVTSHQAYGMGSYCYFNVNPAVVNDHAFEAPSTSGVQFHDLLTVSLGGVGVIEHVINGTGGATPSNTTPVNVTSYP